MHRYEFWQRGRLRRSLGVLALAASLPLAGCNTDDLLSVTDPDIINPEDIATPGGADALRVGALSRFVGTTSGTSGGTFSETLFVWSGMLADEWRTGDTFQQRLEVDSRNIQFSNSGVTDGLRNAHRARLSLEQAVVGLKQYAPNTPAWQVAQLYFAQGFVENMLAEYFCSGVAFSTVVNGTEQYGAQLTTAQVYDRALAHADSALALLTENTANNARIRNAAQVLRGRILVNQGKFAEAAAAVRNVPTGFRYEHQHSVTTRDNVNWFVNNNSRRYTVANNEGGNGLNFATANDPRLPVCAGGSTACRNAGVTQSRPFNSLTPTPLFVQLKWHDRGDNMAIVDGIEARLIEAEAQFRAGDNSGSLATLNALRANRALRPEAIRTDTTALAPLADAGSETARVNQIFRERAFWMFGTGHRLGDLRRLVRQYGRSQATVFPVGNFAEGGTYGSDVNFPVTQPEQNNPSVPAPQGENICLNRNA